MNIYLSLLLCAFLSLSSYGAGVLAELSEGSIVLNSKGKSPKDLPSFFQHLRDASESCTELSIIDTSLNKREMETLLELLKKMRGLTSLHLENIGFIRNPEALVDALKALPGLTSLHLGKNQLGRKGGRDLASALQVMPGLRLLSLSDNGLPDDVILPLVDALKKMSGLTSLHLEHIGFIRNPEALVDALKALPGLTSLHLGKNEIGREGGRDLASALKALPGLRLLNLSENWLPDDVILPLASALEAMPDLTSLDLEYNFLGPQGARALASALEAMPGLTSLNLGNNDLQLEGAQYLLPVLQKGSLTSLNLRGSLGVGGVETLVPALQALRNLESLNLENNGLEGSRAAVLAPALEALKELTSLELGDNNLGYYGLQVLAEPLHRLRSLRVLGLGGNALGLWGLTKSNSGPTTGASSGDSNLDALERALSNKPELRSLDLARNDLFAHDNHFLEVLVKVWPTMPHLMELDLSNNRDLFVTLTNYKTALDLMGSRTPFHLVAKETLFGSEAEKLERLLPNAKISF